MIKNLDDMLALFKSSVCQIAKVIKTNYKELYHNNEKIIKALMLPEIMIPSDQRNMTYFFESHTV